MKVVIGLILNSLGRFFAKLRKPKGLAKTTKKVMWKYNGRLNDFEEQIKNTIGESDDVVVRKFKIAGGKAPAILVFLDPLVDKALVSNTLLTSLMHESRRLPDESLANQLRYHIDQLTASIGEVKEQRDFTDILLAALDGDTVLAVEGVPHCFIFETKGYDYRAVDETKGERSLRGSREGFIENLIVNLSLIRRRIKDPSLRVKMIRSGSRTNTQVAVLYIEGLTNEKITKAAQERIKAIKVDGVLESRYMEQYITDHPYSIFPMIRSTTRPDYCSEYLLSGRVIVLTDNTPFALIIPSVFQDFFQTMEDFTQSFWESSFIRWVRLVAMIAAPLLPALYIALTAVHPELIPTELAISIAGSREGLPFPTLTEVIMMEITMEVLREATIRMPADMGNTIGIVGGLVIGQAAAQAGIISNLMVIIVAFTALATFVPPSLEINISLRILRWGFALAAAFLGLFGIMALLIMVLGHLCSLNSFGIAYLTPLSPTRFSGLLNSLFGRAPMEQMRRRPQWLRPKDRRRRHGYLQPKKGPQLDDED